jgi:hypothetical protein
MTHEGTPGMEHEATLAMEHEGIPAPWQDATLTRKTHAARPAPWDEATLTTYQESAPGMQGEATPVGMPSE